MASVLEKAFTNENWSKNADDYERNMEPLVAHWANDALHIAHLRLLDAVAVSSSTTSNKIPTFLDVGCGTGALCLAFAEKYLSPLTSATTQEAAASPMKDIQIVATDLADGMLARLDDKLSTRPRYQHFRSRINTLQMDGRLLDKLNDESVDIVGSNFGLSIFPDRVKAWSSAARVLKSGGVLFATVWDSQSTSMRWLDACAKLAYDAQLASKKSATGSDNDSESFVAPSTKIGHTTIARELRAAGFRDIEMYRSQHSVVSESPSICVNGMLENPGFAGFIEHAGRERLEDFLYQAIAQEGTFAATGADDQQHKPPSIEQVRKSARPFMINFVAQVVVATK